MPDPIPEESLERIVRSVATIYTDGGCKPNPGPGGYAAIVSQDGVQREYVGGFRWTTNNRMEIMGVIAGLGALPAPCDVVLHSDSLYVIKAIKLGWAARWKDRGWMLSGNQPAANPDLWEQVLALCAVHQVVCSYVRGHSGDRLNDRCDNLASRFAARPDLPDDPGYQPVPAPAQGTFVSHFIQDDHARMKAIVDDALARQKPMHDAPLRMLTWEELTAKAHRTQQQVARIVTRQCRAAGLPDTMVDAAARLAAAKAGEPYYRLRRSQDSHDPTVNGFFQPPEWREQQRLRRIAKARAAREEAEKAREEVKSVVRRRPHGS